MTPVRKYVEGKVVSGGISASTKHVSTEGIGSPNQTVIRIEAKSPTDMTLEDFLTFAEEMKNVAEDEARQLAGGGGGLPGQPRA